MAFVAIFGLVMVLWITISLSGIEDELSNINTTLKKIAEKK